MNIAMEQTEVRKAHGSCCSGGNIVRVSPVALPSDVFKLPVCKACQPSLVHCPQEYVNGQLKNHYGDAFIRGNNGAAPFLAAQWTPAAQACYICQENP